MASFCVLKKKKKKLAILVPLCFGTPFECLQLLRQVGPTYFHLFQPISLTSRKYQDIWKQPSQPLTGLLYEKITNFT